MPENGVLAISLIRSLIFLLSFYFVFASKGNLPMPCLPIIAASVHLYQFMLSKVCLAILYVLEYGF